MRLLIGKFMPKWWLKAGPARRLKRLLSRSPAIREPCASSLHRFNAKGVNGLGMREGAGRKPRLTELERSKILDLAKQSPPGRLERYAETLEAHDEQGSAQWSLDALADAAHDAGIQVERSQIRRIYVCEGKRWRHTHSWGTSDDQDFAPKERRSSPTTPNHQRDRRPSAPTNSVKSIPRMFAPAPGWSVDGHRIKAPLEYSRGNDKVWIYGALRVRDGKELTRCATARNSKNSIELLKANEFDNPTGGIFIITDNLSSHNSLETRTWLADHPRLQQVFIPKGACWLNLQEGWWRLFRRDAFAGQSFANASEINRAMEVATKQLNHRAKPWIWGRPPKTRRYLHRLFWYRL